MYSRILTPLDGSKLSAQAIPYANAFARAFGARIDLFQAVPDLQNVGDMMDRQSYGSMESLDDPHLGPEPEQWQGVADRMREDVLRDLEPWREVAATGGVPVNTKLGEGSAAEAIAKEADSVPGTLLVMTTHGRSGLTGWLMGSVTEKTVRLTSTPSLVVRCRPEDTATVEAGIQRIILPMDGSPLAEQAIPHAVALAKAFNAGIDVLCAVNEPVNPPIPAPIADPTEVSARVGTYAAGIVERLHTEGVVNAEAVTMEEEPAAAIIGAADDFPDSLVVMSTHGRSGFNRWLMGSVADRVIRHSGKPVLLVRAQEEAAQQAA